MKIKTSYLALFIIFFIILLVVARKTTKKAPVVEKKTAVVTEKIKQVGNEIVPPIDRYKERLKIRWFGKYLTPENQSEVSCGKEFTGYHIGDDLEIFPEELNQEVPVFSIADGKVVKAGFVSGYGGLVIIQYTLYNQPVTAYFGHLNLETVTKKEGKTIKKAEKIGLLGKACSNETDGERKHLHFALHKGTEIDLRGYVESKEELSQWLNPSVLQSRIQAGKQNPVC